MNFTIAVSVIIMSPLIVILIRRIVPRKRNVPGELFAEGLRNENRGDYEAALIAYENALTEVKKNRFYSSSMKNQIIEKLKVLNTVIAYKNNSQLRQVIWFIWITPSNGTIFSHIAVGFGLSPCFYRGLFLVIRHAENKTYGRLNKTL